VVVHVYNPSIQEVEGRGQPEYIASCGSACHTQWKKKKKPEPLLGMVYWRTSQKFGMAYVYGFFQKGGNLDKCSIFLIP
jgi:hypothetical protein